MGVTPMGAEDYLEALKEESRGDPTAVNRLFFCRKSLDWKPEGEWRFFAGKPESYVPFEPRMISGVVFGWKMDPSLKRDIARSRGKMPLFSAQPSHTRFAMEMIPIQ